jgi:hypothetical protein|nr:hypothetical protein [Kofleriaceae bacterium]
MKRFVGLVDVAVVVVLLLALVMPPRAQVANAAIKGDDTATLALGFAEARSIAAPTDGRVRAELARRLDNAHQSDWAIEDATRGALAASPATQWRALLAASVAWVDRLDAKQALEVVKKAYAACLDTDKAIPGTCPSWEQTRMELYRDHLEAGLASGIDPKKNPAGFRRAGERNIRTIHIGGHDQVSPAPPPPKHGSADGSDTP